MCIFFIECRILKRNYFFLKYLRFYNCNFMSLHCTVCDVCFSTKGDWYRHLLQESHLNLARQALLNWGGKERACALVIFAKLPLGKDDRVIQFLSKDFGTFVTDFVWWKERPQIGFVQFESRDKMRKILASLQNQQFKIDFQDVREGGSIPELEWAQLLPVNDASILDKNCPPAPSPEPVTRPPNDISQQRDSTFQSSSSSASVSSKVKLQHHLRSIRELTEIPEEEYFTALHLASRLQKAINNRNCRNREKSSTVYRVTVFRHWILKLQYAPKTNKTVNNLRLSIVIYKETLDGQFVSPAGGEFSLSEIARMALTTDEAKKQYFLCYELISIGHTTSGEASFSYKIKLPTSGTPFYFRIVNNANQAMEAQFWRLIQYMCTFDRQCYPVLAVVNYWAQINSVTIGKPQNTCDPGELSDPFGLIWLVMLFLMKERVIPSSKRILDQLHKNQTFLGAYIGSPESAEFVKSWRRMTSEKKKMWDGDSEEFAEEIFTRVFKFFTYMGREPKLTFQIDLPFFENWKISTSSIKEVFSTMKKTGLKFYDCFIVPGRFKMEKMEFDEFSSLFKV